MSISISRYVNINSVVGGVNQIGARSLAACVISINPLVPTNIFLTFTSAASVGTYFGTNSGEYLRAVFYFSFNNKNGGQPQALSFWFWNQNAATGSLIYGAQATYALSSFTSVTTGDFTLTLGGFTHHLTGVNFSSAGSLSAVAADVQTAINAYSGGGAAWTSATVTFNATTGQFNLVSGATGADTVSVTSGTTTDIAGLLGWLPSGAAVPAILSNGTAAQTLTANLTALQQTNNNFGSFVLGATAINTEANIQACVSWNYSLSPNVQFLYCWSASLANFATYQATVAGQGGHCGTLQSPTPGDYPEMIPMAVEASTNYTAQNSVQNYMFQQANSTPVVTTDAAANTYDAVLANYYGQTQTNGQQVSFYQRGVMSGGQATDPQLINVYVNELWLKSAMSTAIMNLLLALANVSANNQGQAQLNATCQSIIQQALFNGTISVGNALSVTQQQYITAQTGNPKAWYQVQSIGWWFNVIFQSYVSNGITQYKAIYTLIYAKDNVINLVQGTDVLI